MDKATCEKCGKLIEGYGAGHVRFLMKQHNMKHEREAEAAQEVLNG